MAENNISKIVSLEIKNFMSIEDAVIDFSDSNVISLCGRNDSGKSAITRLIEIMFYNSASTEQARYIKDGEEFWRGVMTFSDGVVYTREKYAKGSSFWELRKGNDIIYTNKLPNGTLAALNGNPEIIDNYLGVVRDEATHEKLNVRRNRDKLFLIDTTGGQNYSILNSILHSEVLSGASKALNEDKNKLNTEISIKKTEQSVLEEQYNSCDVAPQEEIDEMKFLVKKLEDSNLQLMKLTAIIEILQQISGVIIYDELTSIDTSRLDALLNIIVLKKQISVSLYDNIVDIDIDRLVELKNIMSLRKNISVPMYDELPMVDMSRFNQILELGKIFNGYYQAKNNYAKAVQIFNEKREVLQEISDKYGLKVCPECGAIVA